MTEHSFESGDREDGFKNARVYSELSDPAASEHQRPPEAPVSHITLEIGAGNGTQNWTPLTDRRHFAANEQYIGVDIGGRMVSNISKELVDETDHDMRKKWQDIVKSRPEEALRFIQADGTNLPFKNESVDEIVMSNVFGWGAEEEILPNLLHEADRVLKSQGQIIIHDNITPLHVSDEDLKTVIHNAGLPDDNYSLQRYQQKEQPDQFGSLVEAHGLRRQSSHVGEGSSMIWVLRKRAE